VTRGPNDRGRGSNMNGGPRPARQAGGNGDDASADHRRKLEALFGGGGGSSDGGAPAVTNGSPARAHKAPQERVFSSPRRSLGRSPSEYRLRLERLRMARDVEEIRGATDAFLQHHQLPDDPDVLTKVMQHPTEKVVREAMGQISALIMQGRMPATLILEERLRELDQRAAEDATRSYIKGIQAQLASMKK
jgi:hypothetical protein